MRLPRFIFQAKENLVEKVWGGHWIANFKGLKVFERIGESWEFSAHPSRPSEVLVDGWKVSFADLVSAAKKEILGRLAEKHSSFPLLVKILDIRERISVQVHPSDEVARELGEDEPGKDEGWIILEKGRVYVGFKEGVGLEGLTPEPSEDVLSVLNAYDAEFLDTFMIPAGTVHSAENVRILEISSNSNITYRIYDFRGREVQIEKAMKALSLATSGERVRGKKGRLEMPGFAAEVLEVRGSVEMDTGGVFNLLLCIDGSIHLRSGYETAELRKGFSCLIPAVTGRYDVEGDAMVVKIYAK